MKSILLDSSIYIASLNPQDSFHAKTKDFLLRLDKDLADFEIVVPVLIILEVANILKKPAKDVLSIFTGGEIVEFTLDFIEKLISLFKPLKLKAADSTIVAVAKIYQAELISWDKKLIKESKKLLKAYTPEDYF